MWKWLDKLKLWKRRKSTGPIVYNYGRYIFKPVVARAVSEVMGISQADLASYIANPETSIYLNGELIEGMQWARRRLESGNYEIKMPSRNKEWTFFIA